MINVRYVENGVQVNEAMEKVLAYATYILQEARIKGCQEEVSHINISHTNKIEIRRELETYKKAD